MHYVYVTNGVVTDQCQVDPATVLNPTYAAEFIEAEDEVTFGWIYADGKFSPPPGPSPQQIKELNKAEAESLLQATDWTATVDIADPTYSNPYLANQAEFLAYRSEVRAIAVNPPKTVIDPWPTLPAEVWKAAPTK